MNASSQVSDLIEFTDTYGSEHIYRRDMLRGAMVGVVDENGKTSADSCVMIYSAPSVDTRTKERGWIRYTVDRDTAIRVRDFMRS